MVVSYLSEEILLVRYSGVEGRRGCTTGHGVEYGDAGLP